MMRRYDFALMSICEGPSTERYALKLKLRKLRFVLGKRIDWKRR
jgi:hypothetical protein